MWSGGAEAAFARRVLFDGGPRSRRSKSAGEPVQEDELGVGRLPQQEVGRALLAGTAQEQVDVGDVWLVEEACEASLGEAFGVELALLCQARDLAGRVDDLRRPP